MKRQASGVATLLLGLVFIGCGGGGTKYNKPTVDFDGGASETGAGTDTGGRPPSMPGAGSQLLIPGFANLIGGGPDSCTSQVPASGDRWCGFVVPSALIGQAQLDLLVINVTKAAAGATIKCDGSQLDSCIRLTSDPVLDPTLFSFTGDTLIYFEASASPAADGGTTSSPAFAWRPGWTGGRAITPPGALGCVGHPTTDSVYCFTNRVDDAANNTTADLLAGRMPAAGSVLPKVDNFLAFLGTDDPTAANHFQVQLSRAGDMIAWSARPAAAGVETLNVQTLGDATTKRVVATDVSQWTISRDGSRYYWLKTYNYSPTAPSGTLQQAPFPDGTGPTMVAANVGAYVGAGNTGFIVRTTTGGAGALQAIANRDVPGTVLALDSNVGGIVSVSQDGNRVAYFKAIDSTTFSNVSLVDLHVAGVDQTTPCSLLQAATALPEGFFSASGSAMVWANVNVTSGGVTGAYADLTTCMSHNFAPNLFVATAVGDEGFVYGDQTVDGTDVTLQYATASAGALSAGTVLQTRAGPTFAVLTSLGTVVYTVTANSGGAGDGLYINATLPFTKPSAPADGGSGG